MPVLSRKSVVVLHDAIPLLHPEWFSKGFARWIAWLHPRIIREARWVITDSEASRRDLTALFPASSSKISVVYAGIDARFAPATAPEIARVRNTYRISHPYLLAVSTLDPRKNLALMARAWQRCAESVKPAELVFVGMSSEVFHKSDALAALLRALPRSRWLGFVPDADLPALYSGCRAFVYPSLHEGFGFPPLEAMACGRPVVVSQAGSLPEVCGDAATYVNPLSEDSLVEAMVEVCRNDDRQKRLVERGRVQAARFTWDAAAASTEAVLERVNGRCDPLNGTQ